MTNKVACSLVWPQYIFGQSLPEANTLSSTYGESGRLRIDLHGHGGGWRNNHEVEPPASRLINNGLLFTNKERGKDQQPNHNHWLAVNHDSIQRTNENYFFLTAEESTEQHPTPPTKTLEHPCVNHDEARIIKGIHSVRMKNVPAAPATSFNTCDDAQIVQNLHSE